MLATDIVRKVKRSFGEGGSVFITDTDIVDWINDGQLHISRETGCLTGSATPLANTFPIVYPADFIRVKRMTYNNIAVQFVDVEDLDSKSFDLTTKDIPVFYYVTGHNINLFPTPQTTDTTTVNYSYDKIPTVLATSADALTLPTLYHEDIVRFCLMRAHERNENWKGYEVAQAEFAARMSTRVNEEDVPDDTYTVIRDDPWEYM